jgi:N-acetylated-alpha-linked acidic dipeptidase
MSARRTTRPTPNGSWPSSNPGAGTRISRPSRCSIRRRFQRTLELTARSRSRRRCRSRRSRATSSTATENALPAYVAYQGDGDVTAPLVYVNYGMPDDYKALERWASSVKGKIVIARYGAGWRGLKPKLAQEHGAIGCIIYSDPADDGYAPTTTYPKGPGAAAAGHPARLGAGHDALSRRSADARHRRHQGRQAPADLRGRGDPEDPGAADLLCRRAATSWPALGGPVPPGWRGALPITYHVGPGDGGVHLAVKSDWSLKPIYDVIATMKGSTWPDQWVVRGNHHDGWVFGASDPLVRPGGAAGGGKAIGALAKTGWRPKRTIVYASWDGEEPGLLGSTEWAETHAAELKQKAVLYINSDTNERGFLRPAAATTSSIWSTRSPPT